MRWFRERELREQLERVPPALRVAFAAACAERLRSVLHFFAERAGVPGHATTCDRGLDYAWSHAMVPCHTVPAARLLNEVTELVPDEDAPGWTPLSAYAANALSALAYTLRCLQTGHSQESNLGCATRVRSGGLPCLTQGAGPKCDRSEDRGRSPGAARA